MSDELTSPEAPESKADVLKHVKEHVLGAGLLPVERKNFDGLLERIFNKPEDLHYLPVDTSDLDESILGGKRSFPHIQHDGGSFYSYDDSTPILLGKFSISSQAGNRFPMIEYLEKDALSQAIQDRARYQVLYLRGTIDNDTEQSLRRQYRARDQVIDSLKTKWRPEKDLERAHIQFDRTAATVTESHYFTLQQAWYYDNHVRFNNRGTFLVQETADRKLVIVTNPSSQQLSSDTGSLAEGYILDPGTQAHKDIDGLLSTIDKTFRNKGSKRK